MADWLFRQAILEDIPDVLQFAKDNLQPEWRFCAGLPPYPNIDLMQAYVEADNPFILGFRDGVLMGYQVASRGDGHPLWGLAHKDLSIEDLLEAHAHILAYIWNHLGRVVDTTVVPHSEENVGSELNTTFDRALVIYNEVFA